MEKSLQTSFVVENKHENDVVAWQRADVRWWSLESACRPRLTTHDNVVAFLMMKCHKPQYKITPNHRTIIKHNTKGTADDAKWKQRLGMRSRLVELRWEGWKFSLNICRHSFHVTSPHHIIPSPRRQPTKKTTSAQGEEQTNTHFVVCYICWHNNSLALTPTLIPSHPSSYHHPHANTAVNSPFPNEPPTQNCPKP